MSFPYVPELSEIKEFSPEIVSRLSALRIRTAEQFAALAKTTDGRKLMARHLNLDARSLETLIEASRNSLPEAIRVELDSPVDTSEFGLGAVRPPEKN